MRRMVRPLRAPVPSCVAPLAVVSVMYAPPSGPVAGLAWPRSSAGVLGSVWCFRAARLTVLPRSLGPRVLLLLVRGFLRARARHRDRGFRRGFRLIAGVPRMIAFGTQRGYLLLEV